MGPRVRLRLLLAWRFFLFLTNFLLLVTHLCFYFYFQGAEMETILEEIIVHFRPEPEEELHSAVHALLIKCFQVTGHVRDCGPSVRVSRRKRRFAPRSLASNC